MSGSRYMDTFRTSRISTAPVMLGALIVVLALVPMLFGVYAWTLIRNSDEGGSDDPPPPPPPETPLPIVPPSLCRRDRDAAPPPRTRAGWRAPVRTRR